MKKVLFLMMLCVMVISCESRNDSEVNPIQNDQELFIAGQLYTTKVWDPDLKIVVYHQFIYTGFRGDIHYPACKYCCKHATYDYSGTSTTETPDTSSEDDSSTDYNY